jgi:hypothetical protein
VVFARPLKFDQPVVMRWTHSPNIRLRNEP